MSIKTVHLQSTNCVHKHGVTGRLCTVISPQRQTASVYVTFFYRYNQFSQNILILSCIYLSRLSNYYILVQSIQILRTCLDYTIPTNLSRLYKYYIPVQTILEIHTPRYYRPIKTNQVLQTCLDSPNTTDMSRLLRLPKYQRPVYTNQVLQTRIHYPSTRYLFRLSKY